jgi:hypothetical protein
MNCIFTPGDFLPGTDLTLRPYVSDLYYCPSLDYLWPDNREMAQYAEYVFFQPNRDLPEFFCLKRPQTLKPTYKLRTRFQLLKEKA